MENNTHAFGAMASKAGLVGAGLSCMSLTETTREGSHVGLQAQHLRCYF